MPTQLSTLVSSLADPAATAVGALAPAIGVLEMLEGWPIVALFVVFGGLLFGGLYALARRNDLGQAHAVATGIGGAACLFLLLVVLQLLYRVY